MSCQQHSPTLYQHYTGTEITSGLNSDQTNFLLNGANITIYSGAMHYFRVPEEYWRDRLRKMRAAGLNAVETYVPWNLHEPEPGNYDWGQGGTDFQHLLNIEKFLKIAQEEDLFTIVRPGPYICSEWEFGGLPSWLLRDGDMKIRTSDVKFMKRVESYFTVLLKILSVLQFTRGGSIIAFQIENEYGNVKEADKPIDTKYLELLKEIFLKNDITELLFTSDTPSNGFDGAVPGLLYTANFQNDTKTELDLLKKFQPNKPLMVMEYWTGWFDHWSEKHHTRTSEAFTTVLTEIFAENSSVNFYMFHGGTNWGFINGANVLDSSTDNGGYIPDTSSYDYDAPLSENGDYTDKYHSLREVIARVNPVKTCLPDLPAIIKPKKYQNIDIIGQLTLSEIINNLPDVIPSSKLIPMELLPINNDAGQSYGYVIYRKSNIDIAANSVLKIEGRVCDTVMVLINGVLVSKALATTEDLDGFGYWRYKNSELQLDGVEYINATLELVVENWGRLNYGKLGQFNQHKGLWQGNVLINNVVLKDWDIIPLEFKKSWTKSLEKWGEAKYGDGPSLFKALWFLDEEPVDTYIDTRNWSKGIIILNGFVLSRYCRLGPQQSVYVPAPFIQKGMNEIVIFEHFKAGKEIVFSDSPVFESTTRT